MTKKKKTNNYHHFVFLTSLESTLGVHHPRGGVNFKLAFSPTAFDAILDSPVVTDIFVVRKNLNVNFESYPTAIGLR